jgi:hypothetical protein
MNREYCFNIVIFNSNRLIDKYSEIVHRLVMLICRGNIQCDKQDQQRKAAFIESINKERRFSLNAIPKRPSNKNKRQRDMEDSKHK